MIHQQSKSKKKRDKFKKGLMQLNEEKDKAISHKY